MFKLHNSLFTVLFLLFTTWNGFAQHSSMLYEISGNGLQSPSYLFGTQHMVPKDKFIFPKELKAKIKVCKTIAFETDINPSLKEMMNLMHDMVLPNQLKLAQLMDSFRYSHLEKFILDTLQMSATKWNYAQILRAFFLTSLVLEVAMDKTKSYELEIAKQGKKKNIVELESLEAQLNFIKAIDDTVFLYQINSSMLAGTEKLTNTYLSFNLDSVQKLMTSEPGYEELNEKLIKNRNLNWIPKIETLIGQNSTLVAVGAGHLAGDYGLIALLRNKGYAIKPISLLFKQ